MLTTTEAAEVAAVAPSTIKRWADQGILSFSRTAGGHRRFERFAIERLLCEQPVSVSSGDPVASAWVRCMVDRRRHEIDGRLLEARGRLGSWWRVADELAVALAEMGKQWECGRLTIAEEHVASDALARALARVGDALPIRLDESSVSLPARARTSTRSDCHSQPVRGSTFLDRSRSPEKRSSRRPRG